MAEASPFEAFAGVFDNFHGDLVTSDDSVAASLYFKLKTFLPGLLLVEDKISMAHSLETRVPFLDNDLVDFALALPPRFKLHDLLHAPVVDEDQPGKTTTYRVQPRSDGKQVLRQA